MDFYLPDGIDETIAFFENHRRKSELNMKCCEKIPDDCKEYISDFKDSIRFDSDIISWLTELKERREEEDRIKHPMPRIGDKEDSTDGEC